MKCMWYYASFHISVCILFFFANDYLIASIVVVVEGEEVGADSRLLNNSLFLRKAYVSYDSSQ